MLGLDPITAGILIGLAIGLSMVAGAAIYVHRKTVYWENKLEQMHNQAKLLRQKTDQSAATTQSQIGATGKELASAINQINTLQESLEQHKLQLASLRETERGRLRAVAQASAHLSARQQAEGKAKQAEEMASKAQAQIDSLRAALSQTQEAHAKLESEIQKRVGEAKRLRANVNALQDGIKPISTLEDSVGLFAEASGSLGEILKILVEREGQDAAVLADTNGIVISAVGEVDLKDGMAAASQLVMNLGSRLQGMVTFGTIKSFTLQDVELRVLAGGTFDAAGEQVVLATFGSQAPAARTIDGAIASLSAVLE
ncbi:MAG: hypothetical protein V1754_11070 [Pseudomonadota bacterium]